MKPEYLRVVDVDVCFNNPGTIWLQFTFLFVLFKKIELNVFIQTWTEERFHPTVLESVL